MRKIYIKSANELTPFVARVGFDYGSAEYGQDYSWHEELVWAHSAREAQDMIDNKYSYRKTGQPYDGCFIQYASQEDVARLEGYLESDTEDVEFPFDIYSCSIKGSEAIVPEDLAELHPANESVMKVAGEVLDGVVLTDDNIHECEGILIDNGVDPEIVKDVMQAIGYVLLSVELYPEEE